MKTTQIKVSQIQLLKQVKNFLKGTKPNRDIVDGLVLSIRCDTFYVYLEQAYKNELINFQELTTLYIQYYADSYTREEKDELIKVLQ